MLIDTRQKAIPPGYAGHIPCRSDVVGLPEGRALQLSLATYELFQSVKGKNIGKPPQHNKINN